MSDLLDMHGISKHFGGIQALGGVSLRVQAGSVHALCGANGAGKSTLVRILAGAEHPDAGTIRVAGEEVVFSSPRDAHRQGLRFMHQELNLVPQLTAMQNMAMDYAGAATRAGVLRRRATRARARAVLERVGADIPLDVEVSRLSVTERWFVSLGRSLMDDARLIAMDEPTASFSAEEAGRLCDLVRDLAREGVAILYISHHLDEVLEVADQVTILRDGQRVATLAASALDRGGLTREIVGREIEQLEPLAVDEPPSGPVVMQVERLTRAPQVRSVGFDLRRGEIFGIAGLAGAGRTELARLLFGAERPSDGTMTLDGRPYRPRSPADAIARGVALVPEERRSQALLLNFSVAFNVTMADVQRRPAKARQLARATVERFGIKVASVDEPVANLSGGNQQKVVVGRHVLTGPKVLILDEPTVGVDVEARGEIYRIVRALADAGTAIVLISSDFEELAICHRVAVMREGRITDVLGPHTSKDRLTSLCYAAEQESHD
jgi:ribose transport system ATP-binding protein